MVLVYDDCVDQQVVDRMHYLLLEKAFPWYYQSDMLHNPNTLAQGYVKRPGFINTVWNAGNSLDCPWFDVLLGNTVFKVPPNDVLEISANLLPQTNLEILLDKENTSHTIPHLKAIYYVCDSDGDTVIYNKMYNDPGSYWQEVQASVTPKKGRLAIFDGSYLHASTRPTTGTQCTLNFTFVNKDVDKLLNRKYT